MAKSCNLVHLAFLNTLTMERRSCAFPSKRPLCVEVFLFSGGSKNFERGRQSPSSFIANAYNDVYYAFYTEKRWLLKKFWANKGRGRPHPLFESAT